MNLMGLTKYVCTLKWCKLNSDLAKTGEPKGKGSEGQQMLSLTINNFVDMEVDVDWYKVVEWPASSRISQVAENQGLSHLLRNAFKELRAKNLKRENDHFANS